MCNQRLGGRRLDRRLDDVGAVAGDDVIEDPGELAVPVTKKEPRLGRAPGRSIDSSRACWTTYGPFGRRVTPASRTCRVLSSMKNKT